MSNCKDNSDLADQNNLPLADFWIRLFSFLPDLIILTWVYLIIASFLLNNRVRIDDSSVLANIISFVFAFFYYSLFEGFWKNATLGKLLFKLYVAKVDGQIANIEDSIIRYLSKWISLVFLLVVHIFTFMLDFLYVPNFIILIIFFLGSCAAFVISIAQYFLIFRTQKKQALHDIMAGTIVLQKEYLSKESIILRVSLCILLFVFLSYYLRDVSISLSKLL